MIAVKEIVVKPIDPKTANEFVKKNHYSGKVVPNSQLHFGCFHNKILLGVMQYGPCMKKDAMLGLVRGTGWNNFIELNRMAFSDVLPKNSESRCIGISLRLIEKHYPHIKWVVSFADATQCGDGTIYRASNFFLTGIKENKGLRKNIKTGEILQVMAAHHRKISSKEFRTEWVALPGFQLRYIYFIDKSWRDRLSVDILSFNEIERRGAKMYKGKNGKL